MEHDHTERLDHRLVEGQHYVCIDVDADSPLRWGVRYDVGWSSITSAVNYSGLWPSGRAIRRHLG